LWRTWDMHQNAFLTGTPITPADSEDIESDQRSTEVEATEPSTPSYQPPSVVSATESPFKSKSPVKRKRVAGF